MHKDGPIVIFPDSPDTVSHIPDTRSRCRLSKIKENVCYHDGRTCSVLVMLLACVCNPPIFRLACTNQIKLY